MSIKFTDKEMQEDFDNIPEDRKQKYINEWLARHTKKQKVLFVREWLERKRKKEELENDGIGPVYFQSANKSLAEELESFTPKPTHAIQFELVNGKVISTMVKIGKD
jgi:hypothetical protein